MNKLVLGFAVFAVIASILGLVAFIMMMIRNRHKVDERYDSKSTKLNVIIPIRDREKDLDKITDVLEAIFKKQNIVAKYTIVEQEKGKPFNKAKISNAAFIESIKNNYTLNYLFTDVDLWPLNHQAIDYTTTYGNTIRHPYGTDGSLGGFFLLSSTTFKHLNGYSNEYWGWGAEDTDLEYRSRLLKIPIDRKHFIKRRSSQTVIRDDLSETRKKDPTVFEKSHNFLKKKHASYKENISNIQTDGLSNIVYNVIEKTMYKNKPHMSRILVSI